MKNFIIILFAAIDSFSSFAQKYASIDSVPGAPVFVYTHNTALEIVKDKKFITDNAKIFLDFSKKVLDQNLLKDSGLDDFSFMDGFEMANLILGNYNAAEELLNAGIRKYPQSLIYNFPNKVYLDVKTGKEKTYATAIKIEAKHLDRENFERYEQYYGPGMLNYGPRIIAQTPFAFLSSDTAGFRKNIERMPSSLKPGNPKLSMNQFGDFLIVYGLNLVADAVINDFVKTSPFGLEKWSKVWNSKLYHFTNKDSLHDVLASNYQVFDRGFFDPGILWHNPGEIPGNHIDDDSNGIVDDVYGYEYNIANQKIKEPVALSWKETDSMALVKAAYQMPKYGGPVYWQKGHLDHGSMAVELMLKGNTHVHFMALEHNQYNFPAWYPDLFTTDIAHNQHVVDSLVTLFINSFQEMAAYCNRYKVRVVEINSIGANEKDFNLKGCGKDSAATDEFAKKMFAKLKDGMTKAYLKAPSTLYVNAAGNDSLNINSLPDMINFVRLPNIIIAGALFKDLRKTSYSNYGKGVDVFAPAHFPLQLVKFNYRWGQKSESGGTSAAAPVVANLAIQILELNPNLTAAQVKQLIINGADKEPYEKGVNIINPKKTIALLRAE